MDPCWTFFIPNTEFSKCFLMAVVVPPSEAFVSQQLPGAFSAPGRLQPQSLCHTQGDLPSAFGERTTQKLGFFGDFHPPSLCWVKSRLEELLMGLSS